MKVFDFSNGKRGKFLTTIIRPSASGGWNINPEEKGIRVGDFEFSNNGHTGPLLQYCQYETGKIQEIYGVPAICFCFGKDKDRWLWFYAADEDWLRERNLVVPVVKQWHLNTGQLQWFPKERMFSINVSQIDHEIPFNRILVCSDKTKQVLPFDFVSKEEEVEAPDFRDEEPAIYAVSWLFRNKEHNIGLTIFNDHD